MFIKRFYFLIFAGICTLLFTQRILSTPQMVVLDTRDIELCDAQGDTVTVNETDIEGPTIFLFKKTATSYLFWTLSDAQRLVGKILKRDDTRMRLEDLTIMSHYVTSLCQPTKDPLARPLDEMIDLFERFSIAPHHLSTLCHRWSIAVPKLITDLTHVTTENVADWVTNQHDVAIIDATTGDVLVNVTNSPEQGATILQSRKNGTAVLPFLYVNTTAQIVNHTETSAPQTKLPDKAPPQKSPTVAASSGLSILKVLGTLIGIGALAKLFQQITNTPPKDIKPNPNPALDTSSSLASSASSGPASSASFGTTTSSAPQGFATNAQTAALKKIIDGQRKKQVRMHFDIWKTSSQKQPTPPATPPPAASPRTHGSPIHSTPPLPPAPPPTPPPAHEGSVDENAQTASPDRKRKSHNIISTTRRDNGKLKTRPYDSSSPHSSDHTLNTGFSSDSPPHSQAPQRPRDPLPSRQKTKSLAPPATLPAPVTAPKAKRDTSPHTPPAGADDPVNMGFSSSDSPPTTPPKKPRTNHTPASAPAALTKLILHTRNAARGYQTPTHPRRTPLTCESAPARSFFRPLYLDRELQDVFNLSKMHQALNPDASTHPRIVLGYDSTLVCRSKNASPELEERNPALDALFHVPHPTQAEQIVIAAYYLFQPEPDAGMLYFSWKDYLALVKQAQTKEDQKIIDYLIAVNHVLYAAKKPLTKEQRDIIALLKPSALERDKLPTSNMLGITHSLTDYFSKIGIKPTPCEDGINYFKVLQVPELAESDPLLLTT